MIREPLCARCKHCTIVDGDLICEVFSEKKTWNDNQIFPTFIPPDILSGDFDHTKPYPGDNGIRYEPKD